MDTWLAVVNYVLWTKICSSLFESLLWHWPYFFPQLPFAYICLPASWRLSPSTCSAHIWAINSVSSSSSTCGRNWYADAPAPLPLGWNNWTGMSVSTPRVPQWVWIPVIHNNGLLDIAPCTGFLPWLISLLSYFVLSGTTSSKNYIFSNLWFKMCLTGNPN